MDPYIEHWAHALVATNYDPTYLGNESLVEGLSAPTIPCLGKSNAYTVSSICRDVIPKSVNIFRRSIAGSWPNHVCFTTSIV